ncbi:molybdopterin-guanine dinucleotide biosynthesis protein MobB [Cronobacter sakazakii]|nr:molybdopterin-guanine dinucleotide biosynthesis protein MobB [Cronobacter sakazakii]PWV24862.1 molybdopterin-guanine dinucleotide biosynthesis protein MobB [Cronobacter sakazakii]
MRSVGVLLRSLILVKGFKHEAVAKIMLFREGAGRDVEELTPDDHVIAIASDRPLSEAELPVLDINEPAQVAAFIADWLTVQRAQGSFRR